MPKCRVWFPRTQANNWHTILVQGAQVTELYRQHIKKMQTFRDRCTPGKAFHWNTNYELAYNVSKDIIISEQKSKGVEIHYKSQSACHATDCFRTGVGLWLLQKQRRYAKVVLICCYTGRRIELVNSRSTSTAERRRTPADGELFTLADALDKATYLVFGCWDLPAHGR